MATRKDIREQLRRQVMDEGKDKWSDDVLNDAINFALDDAWPSWYIVKTDSTTIPIVTSTYSYSLPSDCEYLAEVWLEQSSSTPWVRLWNWRASDTTSGTGVKTHKLYLDNNDSYETGKYLRLIYEAVPPHADNDTDTITVPTPFILFKGKVYLYERMLNSGPAHSVDLYVRLLGLNQQMAEDYRQRNATPHLGGHVHYTTDGGGDLLAQPGIVDRHR